MNFLLKVLGYLYDLVAPYPYQNPTPEEETEPVPVSEPSEDDDTVGYMFVLRDQEKDRVKIVRHYEDGEQHTSDWIDRKTYRNALIRYARTLTDPKELEICTQITDMVTLPEEMN